MEGEFEGDSKGDFKQSIQIVHLFLEVPSMNKMRVAREPRATGDFIKVARGKKS